MSLFLDIRKNPDLSQSERFIAEYIITHPNNIMEMTMDELAQATFTSRSSVLRLCKKNGYKGFHELKTQLAMFDSPSWTRANNHAVNSRVVYCPSAVYRPRRLLA